MAKNKSKAQRLIGGDFYAKSCTCEGKNPHCYKCGGWGYLKGPRLKPTLVLPEKSVCSFCGQGGIVRMKRHLQKIHGIEVAG
jgi:hypothetical protein